VIVLIIIKEIFTRDHNSSLNFKNPLLATAEVMPLILVIDDDPAISELVSINLKMEC